MARRTTDFQTICSEGGLLPPDLLRRVLDPKSKLDGNSIAARTRGIDEAPDDTIGDLQRKAEQFRGLVVSP